MRSFVMLSVATEWLDGLRGVVVWEVLLCYHLQQSGCRFEGSVGMGSFVMLSVATERLDGLRGVLVLEVLLCYH